MLELKFVRENSAMVKENLTRRGDEVKMAWVDQLLENDRRWRGIRTEADNLRSRRNKLTEQIAQARRQNKDTSQLVREAEQIPDQIKTLEREGEELEGKVTETLMQLPNIMHESVPVGKDENDNVEVRKWGKPPDFDFKPRDHIDIATSLGLIDLERAAKVAGARFYYLRGDLVKLNYALIRLGLDFSEAKGYQLTQPPYLLRRGGRWRRRAFGF